MRRLRLALLGLALLILAGIVGWWLIRRTANSPTRELLDQYFSQPDKRAALITDLKAPCPSAPFLLPSTGFVGLLYSDPTAPYTPLNKHPGIDIFGNGEPDTIPIYAAYDGYLTRLPDWKSAVIVRIPKDPLDPSRQIWTYYTHMASLSGDQSYISSAFPLGSSEIPVKQGTLLGYQGLYAGVGAAPIKMHVHFSVVLSDSAGSFRNETRLDNTLDPSPYFGLTLNASKAVTIPVRCGA
ncbi:MAG: hypothetical protein ABI947_02905 [Chloroflexota bacterium]